MTDRLFARNVRAPERYDLDIPTAEPVVAYLASMTDVSLTVAQQSAAREFIEARIETEGGYRVRKDTVLITASR